MGLSVHRKHLLVEVWHLKAQEEWQCAHECVYVCVCVLCVCVSLRDKSRKGGIEKVLQGHTVLCRDSLLFKPCLLDLGSFKKY